MLSIGGWGGGEENWSANMQRTIELTVTCRQPSACQAYQVPSEQLPASGPPPTLNTINTAAFMHFLKQQEISANAHEMRESLWQFLFAGNLDLSSSI